MYLGARHLVAPLNFVERRVARRRAHTEAGFGHGLLHRRPNRSRRTTLDLLAALAGVRGFGAERARLFAAAALARQAIEDGAPL